MFFGELGSMAMCVSELTSPEVLTLSSFVTLPAGPVAPAEDFKLGCRSIHSSSGPAASGYW